jgi:hypothetical protein
VDDIREKRALSNLDPEQQTVVDFTRELLQHRKVSRPTFDAATARFGQRGTMTLTNLIACYAVLAYSMNTYELEAPAHPTEKALMWRSARRASACAEPGRRGRRACRQRSGRAGVRAVVRTLR